MTLRQYFDKYKEVDSDNLNGTDKDTKHSYIDLYDSLLKKHKNQYRTILEIGVLSGGSCAGFADYFDNATVYAVDIDFKHLKHGIDHPKIKFIQADGTSEDCLTKLNLSEIDFVLDDGSHRPDDQIKTAKLFVPLISKNGLFICEDIDQTHQEYVRKSFENISNQNNMKLDWYDLRYIKNRFDDIVAVIHH
jgi:cephalosporin hydroxylase